MAKTGGLGKGLGALISSANTTSNKRIESNNGIIEIKMDSIINNIEKNINNDELNELAKSIKKLGVIEPIIVRKEDEQYKLIVGEKRFRAAKIAGKERIPAVVTKLTDKEAEELNSLEKEIIKEKEVILEKEVIKEINKGIEEIKAKEIKLDKGKDIDRGAIKELSTSIKKFGIMQPLILTKSKDDNIYSR